MVVLAALVQEGELEECVPSVPSLAVLSSQDLGGIILGALAVRVEVDGPSLATHDEGLGGDEFLIRMPFSSEYPSILILNSVRDVDDEDDPDPLWELSLSQVFSPSLRSQSLLSLKMLRSPHMLACGVGFFFFYTVGFKEHWVFLVIVVGHQHGVFVC